MPIRFTIPSSGLTIEGAYLSDVEDLYVAIPEATREFFAKHVKRSIDLFEGSPGVGAAVRAPGRSGHWPGAR